jgi:hypothetical protein
MLFNNHLAKAEAALVAAVNQLKGANITDLIIDLRYNGGGYLDIANQFAFMIAGASATNGKFFEKSMFNDKYPNQDPVTGQSPIYPFRTTTMGFSVPPPAQALPTLGLRRVFFLVGSGTCSASESLINGLRGVDVQVFLIGNPTCGKPYGFYPEDNCGTTYFTIQIQTVNYKGFGDYADGFTPGGTSPAGVPGCMVADDLNHDLGDPAEARLAAALNYIANPGTCPTPSQLSLEGAPPEGDLQIIRPPWQENRIMPRW